MKVVEKFAVDEVDLSDLEFWAEPLEVREGAFRTLRRERPIAFFEEPEITGTAIPIPKGPGFYAITRHAHILEISRNPDLYCSGTGATSIPDLPPEFLEFFGSMINLDDPRHARLRRIVSAAFTPKTVRRIEDDIARQATRIVDEVIDRGECDFVTDVAAPLPLRIICEMMGIPESEHEFVFRRSNTILGAADPEYVPEGDDPTTAILTAGQELATLVEELGKTRADDPRDDITSALVSANVDGESLTYQELASFFILLVVAGNETTRNAISHGLVHLTENPDQRDRWWDDLDGLSPTAVDEIVRVASPVVWMRRTVTEDTRLDDHEFSAGDKVILLYLSANRDEDVFDDPYRFDVGRDPNPHVGFGGPGPHFCLGAHLARQEITVMFRELLSRVPDIEAAGEPVRLRSSFINGIKHLPARFTPGGAG